MTPERWRRIEEIFHEVLERPAEERSEVLKLQCRDDLELVEEVGRLVDAAQRTDGFFDRPPGISAAEVEPEMSGRTVGPYRLERLLGRGGMGVVYLARHEDEALDRKVAVKLLHTPFDDENSLRRFRDEQRALSRLEHPNVARLYDGGVDVDGRAYVAMEWVDGLPITTHCERHGLSIDERLILFETVCRTVQAVHQQLIIHRDLKPGNILVTESGTVKLLDFGVAKRLDVDATRTGDPKAMTLAYASPEQVRGESAGTASDVYSLGVVFFEVLTGERPFSPEQVAATAVAPPGLRGAAPLASAAVAARGDGQGASSCRRLRGDLDTILRKALAEDPTGRYGTAAALADDISNHRSRRPLAARPPSALYRLRCLVLRNRLASASLLAVLLVLGVATLMLAAQNRQIRSERDAAEQARIRTELAQEETEAVVSFLDGVFLQADPSEAPVESADLVSLLAEGVERQRETLADRPLHLARILMTVGRTYHGWGLFDQAGPYVEEAADTFRRHGAPEDGDRLESLALLSDLRREQGRFAEAEELLGEQLETLRRHVDGGILTAAEQTYSLIWFRLQAGDLQDAEALARNALEILEAAPEADRLAMARTLQNLGFVLNDRGRTEEAVAVHRRAVALDEELLPPLHPLRLSSAKALAQTLSLLGELAEAEALLIQVLKGEKAVFADHPRLGFTYDELGSLSLRRGDLQAAEARFREAAEHRRRTLHPDHPAVGVSLRKLGGVLERSGQDAEAEETYRRSLELTRGFPPGSWQIVVPLHRLGALLTRTERPEEALPLLREAVAIATRAESAPSEVAQIEIDLADCLLDLGRTEEGHPLLETALTRLAEAPDEELVARARALLGS